MADNEVKLVVSVETEGEEKLADVSKSMGNLNKTSTSLMTTTNKNVVANQMYNTSLVKAIPQMQVMTPLMNSLGLGSLMTAGAVGLVGLGLAKTAQTAIAAQGAIVDLGLATAQYTSGPATTFANNLQHIKNLSAQYSDSTAQISASLQTLTEATHSSATAESLLNQVNTVSINTHKTMSQVAKETAAAYTGGAWINGQYQPAGMGAATAYLSALDTQKSTSGQAFSGVSRWMHQFFDVNSTGFLGGLTTSGIAGPRGSSQSLNINIDGNTVANAVLDNVDGQIRLRGGQ